MAVVPAGLSHSGRYEVRAINGGGEARSAADLLIVEPPEALSGPLLPSVSDVHL